MPSCSNIILFFICMHFNTLVPASAKSSVVGCNITNSLQQGEKYNIKTGAFCSNLKEIISVSSTLTFEDFIRILKHYLHHNSYRVRFQHINRFQYGWNRGNENLAYTMLKWSVINLQPPPNDLWLEFGVAGGYSINLTAVLRQSTLPVYGFDSFFGLPEEWNSLYRKGYFSQRGVAPPTEKNVILIPGLFNKTLVPFLNRHTGEKAGFINIDMDLYDGAIFVLRNLKPFMQKGTIIHFHDLTSMDVRVRFLGNPSDIDQETLALFHFLKESEDITLQLMPFYSFGYRQAVVFRVL